MTEDRFARTLNAWLEDDARARVPSHLDELLVHTVATRQRPWWSSPERWLPVNIAAARAVSPRVPVGGLLLAALLLILAAAALALIAGSQHRVPAPFGPARNGVIGTGANGDIVVANADGSGLRTVVSGPENDEGMTFSRAGTQFVFNRLLSEDTSQVMIANADGSNVRPLIDHPLGMAWWFDVSPSDHQVVVAYDTPGHRDLAVVDIDDPGNARTLVLPGIEKAGFPIFRAPDGKEIVFVGDPAGPHTAALYAVRPDGTGLHQVGPVYDVNDAYYSLDLTPDGKTAIYWNVDRDATGSFAVHIHELDVDSGADRIVTFRPDGTEENDPHLSPDGRLVVSARWLPGHMAQYQVAPIDGSAPARLIGPTFPNDDNFAGLFSPDGRQFALFLAGQAPVFIDVATGQTTTGPAKLNAGSWQRTAP
jgi:hypothetical protein